MPLTAITIQNFKGIGEAVTIPLRPLTLLFGANSAGKSTIIQALQYAWEVLENRNADVDRTRLGGEAIDLGGFKNLVHGHDLSRSICITLHYRGPLKSDAYVPPEYIWSEMDGELKSEGWVPNMRRCVIPETLSITVETGWEHGTECAVVKAFKVGIDGSALVEIRGQQDGLGMFRLQNGHPLFSPSDHDNDYEARLLEHISVYHLAHEIKELLALDSPEIDSEVRAAFSDAEDGQAEEMINSFHDDENQDDWKKFDYFVDSVVPSWGQLLRIRYGLPVRNSNAKSVSEETCYALSQIICGAGDAVLEELRGLRYIGPLRVVPERGQRLPLHAPTDRWANGLGAWDALMRSEAREELVQRTSHHLRETLGLSYTISRERRVSLDLDGEVMAQLRLLVLQYEDNDATALRDRVLRPLELMDCTPFLVIHDENNDIDVELMDVGVGVSQVLPVIVGAVEPHCNILAIEQPELHVHPAVQSRLGDLFIQECIPSQPGTVCLLETHSEHLILRILRRIRESTDGELPPGYPGIYPDDVQVAYVENREGKTIITPLEITPDGDFVRDWPNGFFTEREEDLF